LLYRRKKGIKVIHHKPLFPAFLGIRLAVISRITEIYDEKTVRTIFKGDDDTMIKWETIRADVLKPKPTDESALGFGKIFTDHMFFMRYDEGQGWHDARIQPYQEFSLNPAAMVLHYGQAIFEGLKAYCNTDGGIQLFRPEQNMARFNRSAERLCIPAIDEASVLDALKALVRVDADWIPRGEGTSLYIRPTGIAVDPGLGVRVANSYYFFIIMSPVGSYYSGGLKPTKILVENEYVRAVRGGMGFAKAAGNYACSLIADHTAKKFGCDQVLWLDGVERKYIEEVGAMNVFFKIGGELITPPLAGSILGGITRDSIIQLSHKNGLTVREEPLSIDGVLAAQKDGTLEEVFGSGTAAVIAPVGTLVYKDTEYCVGDGGMGPCALSLFEELTGIQKGILPDSMGWIQQI